MFSESREFIAMALFLRKVCSCFRTLRDITAAFIAIELEPKKIGLAVNEGKTKYLLSTSRDVRPINSQITAGNYTFDTVKEFYLDPAVTTKNYVSLEIKFRITLVNSCYYGLNGQLSNRDLPQMAKLILYKALILHVHHMAQRYGPY